MMTDPRNIPRRQALRQLGIATTVLGFRPLERPVRAPGVSDADDFELLLRLSGVPSMNVAIVEGGRITTTAFGLRSAGATDRALETSVYSAASLTKSVFTFIFLGLADEGVVSLDTPVSAYLPLPNPDDQRALKITARHLLSHTSGWRNWRFNATQPLTADFEPGTRWSYSGEGFFHLQRIAEKLTGRSFAQLARERVFEPLGMQRSSMVALAELEADQLPGYNGRGDQISAPGRPAILELRRMMGARNASLEAAKVEDAEKALRSVDANAVALPVALNPNAAASMLTTAGDFARFLRHIVTAKRGGGAPTRIAEMMFTPQIRCNEAVQWGLGVGLEDVKGERYAWQWGDNPGYKNIYFANRARERAIVVFTNSDRGARVYERAIRSLTGVDHPGFLWV